MTILQYICRNVVIVFLQCYYIYINLIIFYLKIEDGVFMDFSNKLNMIMTILNCNNSRLGRGINVDPSLISRWKSGSRKLKPNSPYIPLIVDFLLRTEPMAYQIESINNMLGTEFQLKKYGDICKFKNALIEWLSSPNESLINYRASSSDQNSLKFNTLMEKLSDFSFEDTSKISIPQSSSIKNTGRETTLSVYSGIEGKRNAVLNIMNTLLSSDKPRELLCFSDENVEWLTGDRDFYLKWAFLMKAAVNAGHKIKIIHIINRSPNEIMEAIDQWAPLHLTGKLESYYMPKYVANRIKKSFWVIPNILASGAITASLDELCECTYISEDEEIVNNMEGVFEGLLSSCRKYFKIYNSSSAQDFTSSLLEFDAAIGNVITLKDNLTSVTLPENVLKRMLNRTNLSTLEKNIRIELHKQRQKSFLKNLSRFKVTDILSIDALFDIISVNLNSVEDISSLSMTYEPQDLYDHIMSIIGYLKEYDNYKFIPIKKDMFNYGNNIFISVKDATGSILGKWNNNPAKNIVIMTYEDLSSTVLYNMLNSQIDKLPYEHRDKNYIIPRLEAYAQRIF